MSFEEMIVALVGAIGGIALVGFIVAKITGLIKSWINRNKNAIPEEEFDRLARAFIEQKKDTQRRLQNLEAIIAEEDSEKAPSETKTNSKRIESAKQSIEIKDRGTGNHEKSSNNDNNLRNMLRE